MFADPIATAVAKPEALTVATALLSDAYVESLVVTFEVWPSRYVAVRANCCVAATAIVGFAGVSLTPVINRLLTSELMHPDKPRIESKGRIGTSCLTLSNELPPHSPAGKPQIGSSIWLPGRPFHCNCAAALFGVAACSDATTGSMAPHFHELRGFQAIGSGKSENRPSQLGFAAVGEPAPPDRRARREFDATSSWRWALAAGSGTARWHTNPGAAVE